MGGAIFDAYDSYDLAFLIGVVANCINLVIIGALLTRTRPRNQRARRPKLSNKETHRWKSYCKDARR